MTTEILKVVASADDAEQGDSTVLVTASRGRLYQGSNAYSGHRWVPGSTIPKGSTIVSATLSVKFYSTDYDSLDADTYIAGENGANPAQFTTASNDISSRSETSTKISATVTDAGTDWVAYDVATIIQELATAYAIQAVVLWVHDPTGNSVGAIVHYDGSAANAARLDIEYNPPAGGIPRLADYYRRMRT